MTARTCVSLIRGDKRLTTSIYNYTVSKSIFLYQQSQEKEVDAYVCDAVQKGHLYTISSSYHIRYQAYEMGGKMNNCVDGYSRMDPILQN